MSLPNIVSPDVWLAARKELLVKEKALTKAQDELNADRRRLPMVEINKDYVFEGPDGKASLLDLFEGRRQLVIYHFMFDPTWDAGCKSCSSFVDQIGHLTHLHVRDTSFAAISRAPISKITPFKERMGWTVPWYSSYGIEFNYDFNVTLDESVKPIVYNFRTKQEHIEHGTGYYVEGDQPFELPGMSAFLRDGDRVFHTYSAYARGVETATDTTSMLDITALGRLGPPAGSPEMRYRDEY